MILIILNLFILESLLSVDNAAVLALMVKDLPPGQQKKALRYGIAGAFIFRGLSLLFAAWLIRIVWLKFVGAAYLLYLVYDHFAFKEEGEYQAKESIVVKALRKRIGLLWATVVLVEIMDMAFSIDNIFAAVAMTNNIYLILTGVCMGIVAMRFVAQWFVRLIKRYPSMETSAFVVIGLLAVKLILSGMHLFTGYDGWFSAVMMLIFFIPLITKKNARLQAR